MGCFDLFSDQYFLGFILKAHDLAGCDFKCRTVLDRHQCGDA